MNPTLIPIKQDLPGFERFIGSWVCVGEINMVIDVGPSVSVNRLIKALTDMGVDRVDCVALTHIHIDHAGGLALFLEHFPMATVICHEKGIKHLVDPTRLWAGSLKTLGEIAGHAFVHQRLHHIPALLVNETIVSSPCHARQPKRKGSGCLILRSDDDIAAAVDVPISQLGSPATLFGLSDMGQTF